MKFSHFTKVKHHLGDSASKEDLDGCEVLWAVRKGVDEAWNFSIKTTPVIDLGTP
jgi:hypothetical protein